MQQNNPNKLLFQSSHLGRGFTVNEMKEHLNQLITPQQTQQAQILDLPTDLTGKQIQHRWIVEGDAEWFHGTIIGKVAGQQGTGMWYNIKYDGEDQIITLNLKEDIDIGDLIIL